MLGRRGVGTIIGIVSACSLFFLLILCCIVYYRRHLRRKGNTYVTTTQTDDERQNEQVRTEQQPRSVNRATNYSPSDAPPPYHEAVQRLNDV